MGKDETNHQYIKKVMAADKLERRVRFVIWLLSMALFAWASWMFIQAVRILCQIAGAR